MAKDLAIVLCDGGLTSAVAATLASQKYRLVMLNAEMGGQGESRRRAAYDMLVGHLRPFRDHSLVMNYMNWVRKSSPDSAHVDPRAGGELAPRLTELTPLIATAVRFAAHYQAAAIYCGLRVGPDGPDLAKATEFGQIWTEMAQHPCGLPDLEVQLPLLELELWQVVDLGVHVGCPLDKTWSCDLEHADPCGICAGCRQREVAFEQAAKPDPLRRKQAV